MNSIELVNRLHPYHIILNELEARELPHGNGSEESITGFRKSVSLRYNTLVLKLDTKSAAYMSCNLEIADQNVSINSFYCENENREDDMRVYLLQHMPTRFTNSDKGSPSVYNDETLHYLTLADEIAKLAHLRSSGDDYRPGYFSEISIENDRIVLNQVNHWNSRSINHKKDYHLRDLKFIITLTSEEVKPSFGDEQIGRMIINFSDRSSENNRACGESIREKIDEEKLRFEMK